MYGGPRRNMPVLLLPGDQPVRRHPGDLLRLGIGAGIFIASALIASAQLVGPLESNLFRLINELPAALYDPLYIVMQLGSYGAVVGTVGLALLGRRPRLAL